MTEYMYLVDEQNAYSLKKVENYYSEIELKRHEKDKHVCKVHYNSRLDRLIIITDYPERPRHEESIEHDIGFIILCNKACDRLIDYFLELYMSISIDRLGEKLQHRMDLIKSLQTFLVNGNIIE